MVRNKLFLLPALCLIIFAQSCIHGDLDDCPPMVNYAVAFEYTHHMYGGDRVYDDVKKIDLFVFDENDLVYTTTTSLGPSESNFTIPLNLPMGKYHIIAWGNIMENDSIIYTPSLTDFKKGTKFQDARLSLLRNSNNIIGRDLEKIFYGDINAVIPLYASRVDTIPLINDTHNIRVVLHWDHTDAAPISYGQYLDYDNIDVKLHGHNAIYAFDDLPVQNDVCYDAYDIDRTGEKLRVSTWEHSMRIYYYPDAIEAEMDSTVFDFKVLRMVPGNQLVMTVLQQARASSTDIVNLLAPIESAQRKDTTFGIDIVGSFTDGNGFSKYQRDYLNVTDPVSLQRSFDKYDNYRVDIYLKYNKFANTYFTLTDVKIQDWHKKEIDVPGWAD